MAHVTTTIAGACAGLAAQACVACAAADEIVDRFDAYMAPLVEAGHFSGSILAVRGEEIVYQRSFGAANAELGVPMSAASRLNVASLTKPMTQIIAYRLIEAGALSADDPISLWLPDFPRAADITVQMLLDHRAGIAHRVTSELEETAVWTAQGVAELASRSELVFEPGADSSYSSAGYSVLARVLELASGLSYAELLAREVSAPANLTATAHPSGRALIRDRASPYQLAGDGSLINAPYSHYSFLVGAGSVFSTPTDLVAVMQTVVEGGYGPAATERLVRDEGLSWNGRSTGYAAYAAFDPQTGVYAAFAMNIVTGAAELLRRDIVRLAAGEDVAPPAIPVHAAASVSAGALARYEGAYELRPGRSLALSVDDAGEVRMEEWILTPTSETTFFSPQDYAEVAVVLNDDGQVERLDWTVIGGQTYPMPRVEE